MADAAKQWKRIVRRQGQEKLAEVIKANRKAWPSVVDSV